MLTFKDSSIYWDERYKNKQDGWNLDSPTPIFEQVISDNKLIQPCQILISGSGKGFDAIIAAKAGYKVTAVDFAPSAISFSKNMAKGEKVEIDFIEEDIFMLPPEFDDYFDAVYDYTTFCAINPERRAEYASKLNSVLKPGGKFIALLFPVESREGGPPFGIDVNEFYKIFSIYFKLEFSSKRIASIKPRKGREVLQIYRKPLLS